MKLLQDFGNTALIAAASEGNLETLHFLLERDCNTETTNVC